jgi:hypothetical protein
LAVGIEGDRLVGLVLTGDLGAGVEDGTFTLVMLVLDDNRPSGLATWAVRSVEPSSTTISSQPGHNSAATEDRHPSR